MIHRFLFISTVMLLSALILSARANADAIGNVESKCLLDKPTEGKLVLINGAKTFSTGDDGIPATIEINCNKTATLTISKPIQTSDNVTKFTDMSATASSSVLSPTSINNGGTGMVALPASGTIVVNMEATDSSEIAPGKYTFTVTITATP